MNPYFCFPNKPVRVASMETFFSAVRGRESDWVLQSKHDGDRAIVVVDGDGVVSVYSRHGNLLVDARNWVHLAKLPLRAPFTLDGELVNEKLIVIWDYAYEDAKLLGTLPYQQRLERVLSLPNLSSISGHSVRPVESRTPSPRAVQVLLKGDRVEGLVAKRCNARDLWGIVKTRETASQVKWTL